MQCSQGHTAKSHMRVSSYLEEFMMSWLFMTQSEPTNKYGSEDQQMTVQYIRYVAGHVKQRSKSHRVTKGSKQYGK